MSQPKPSINNIDLGQFEDLGKRTRKPSGTAKAPARVKDVVAKDLTTPEPSRTAAKTIDKIKQRAAAAKLRTNMSLESRVLQAVLPLWDNENRGVPNPFIRSGLFSVKNTEKREYLAELKIEALSNYDIRYTGVELQQDDLSVWMSLINMAKTQPMSEAVYFSGYQLVKDLGWRMHSESYARAQQSIERLKVTAVKLSVNNDETGYAGSLIRDYGWTERDEKDSTKWMVRFEPRITKLFLEDTTTLLEWETRKKIGTRATLALWLHSFYSSHMKPYPVKVETFWELCRSGDSLSSFRRNIRNALTKLVTVGFLKRFDITNDLVTVDKGDKLRLVRPK